VTCQAKFRHRVKHSGELTKDLAITAKHHRSELHDPVAVLQAGRLYVYRREHDPAISLGLSPGITGSRLLHEKSALTWDNRACLESCGK
jgi:hypothetical protein